MGWDWVRVLKEEMLDLKSDEHLSRHAATDRLAWVSSQAPARAPSPVDEWRDYPPNTPPAGGALLGFDEHRADGRSSLSGFNDGPLYGGSDGGPARGQAGEPHSYEDGTGTRRDAEPVDLPNPPPELPPLNDFDFAMPTAPPLEYPVAQAPGGFPTPVAGASLLSNPAPAPSPSPFGSPPSPFQPPRPAMSPPAGAGAYGQPAYGQPAYGQPAYGQSAFGDGSYGDGGPEQGYVLTLLIDGVLAGVALPGGGEVSVGRERQSTLVIPESKQTVSRRAATLVRTGQRTIEARIENRNGAWVTRQLPEGTRQEFIERGKGVTLRIGDRLALDPPGTVVVGLGEPH